MPEPAEAGVSGGDAPSSGRFSGPAERLRTTAKWLVVSAGAVAAVVVAGLNFADIGKLTPESPDYRLWIALAGAAIAFGGITWMLVATVALAGASTVGVRELRGRDLAGIDDVRAAVDADTALAYWKGEWRRGHPVSPFELLAQDLESAQRGYVKELTLWSLNPHPKPSTSILNRQQTYRDYLQALVARSLETASYLRLLWAFRRTCNQLLAALLLTGTGLIAVVWASNPPDDPALAIPATPVAATYAVPADNRADLTGRLGSSCAADLDALPVIVLSVDDEKATAIVVVSATDCTPLRLHLPSDLISS